MRRAGGRPTYRQAGRRCENPRAQARSPMVPVAYFFLVELICDSIFASTAFTSSICCWSFFSASRVLSAAGAEAGGGFVDALWLAPEPAPVAAPFAAPGPAGGFPAALALSASICI